MTKKILAPIFTDNMVLQRQKPINIFGKCNAGEAVTVIFNGQSLSGQCDENGNFKITFPAMEATTGLTLTAKTETDQVILNNIAIGEVWLAGGQSNMEFEIQNCTDWERVKNNPDSRIRFFYTPKLPYVSDAYKEAFDKAHWMLTDDEAFKTWSAVGYLFAERLLKDIDVTVGILGCNWGGTSASAWMDRNSILLDESTRIYMDEFEDGIKGISLKEQQEAYDTYEAFHEEWNAKCGQMYIDDPNVSWSHVEEVLGKCQWPGPMNSYNPFRPCGLYDIMLKPVSPYTLKGVIWYQGESDDHRPRSYYALFKNMIGCWRRTFEDDTLPFIITQLPMHKYSADEDFKNWPIIREAQLRAAREIPAVSTAVIIECGEFNEIHPKNKGPVGERLALMALTDVYKSQDSKKSYAPVFDKKEIDGNRILVYFKNVVNGLSLKGEPEYYEVAGADKVFYKATVKVVDSHIELSATQVDSPVYGRYCWTNYCNPTLFDGRDMPVSPFRTDEDDEADTTLKSATIQQIMEV